MSFKAKNAVSKTARVRPSFICPYSGAGREGEHRNSCKSTKGIFTKQFLRFKILAQFSKVFCSLSSWYYLNHCILWKKTLFPRRSSNCLRIQVTEAQTRTIDSAAPLATFNSSSCCHFSCSQYSFHGLITLLFPTLCDHWSFPSPLLPGLLLHRENHQPGYSTSKDLSCQYSNQLPSR